MGEIIGEASTVIFEEIFTDKKYRYSSRYLFPFNQKVDDRYFKGNQSNDIEYPSSHHMGKIIRILLCVCFPHRNIV